MDSARSGQSAWVSQVSDLEAITSLIHDEYFDVERVIHDRATDEVRIPIYSGTHRKRWIGWTSRPPEEPLPPPLGVLVIRGVRSVTVADAAQIGWVDVSRITYDEERREVILTSNVPVEVRMQVDTLNVELVRS